MGLHLSASTCLFACPFGGHEVDVLYQSDPLQSRWHGYVVRTQPHQLEVAIQPLSIILSGALHDELLWEDVGLNRQSKLPQASDDGAQEPDEGISAKEAQGLYNQEVGFSHESVAV
jgi:hypothetical protein